MDPLDLHSDAGVDNSVYTKNSFVVKIRVLF
jgi:hypothetical protein